MQRDWPSPNDGRCAPEGVRGPLPEAGPSELNVLCLQATEPDPANRIPTVDIFREKLTHWLETSESRTLTDRALVRLEALEALTTLTPEQRQEGVGLLGVLEQAGTAGAGLEDAIVGERRTRILLARAALATGEAGLARILVSTLPEVNGNCSR